MECHRPYWYSTFDTIQDHKPACCWIGLPVRPSIRPSIYIYIYIYIYVYTCVCMRACVCVTCIKPNPSTQLPVPQLLNNVHHRAHNSPTHFPAHNQPDKVPSVPVSVFTTRLTLSSHLHLGLQIRLMPWGFSTKIPFAFLFCRRSATRPNLHLITLIIFGEQQTSWISSFGNFLHSPVRHKHLPQNPSTSFSITPHPMFPFSFDRPSSKPILRQAEIYVSCLK